MKKFKLFFSILSLCFSLAILCFGVFAAQQVNYAISGTVTYSATEDVFADIQTKVYRSKSQNVLPKTSTDNSVTTLTSIHTALVSATSNLDNVATGTGNGQLGLEAVTLTQRNGNTVNNGDVSASTITSNGTLSSETSFSVSGLNLEYGQWANGNNKGYAYFIVVQITNRGVNPIGVTVTTSGFNTSTLNSNLVKSGTNNAQSNGTHNQVTNFVFAFGLNNPTVGIESNATNFNFSLSLSKNQINMGHNVTYAAGSSYANNSPNYPVVALTFYDGSEATYTFMTGTGVFPDDWEEQTGYPSWTGQTFGGYTFYNVISVTITANATGDGSPSLYINGVQQTGTIYTSSNLSEDISFYTDGGGKF